MYSVRKIRHYFQNVNQTYFSLNRLHRIASNSMISHKFYVYAVIFTFFLNMWLIEILASMFLPNLGVRSLSSDAPSHAHQTQ